MRMHCPPNWRNPMVEMVTVLERGNIKHKNQSEQVFNKDISTQVFTFPDLPPWIQSVEWWCWERSSMGAYLHLICIFWLHSSHPLSISTDTDSGGSMTVEKWICDTFGVLFFTILETLILAWKMTFINNWSTELLSVINVVSMEIYLSSNCCSFNCIWLLGHPGDQLEGEWAE